MTIRCSPSGEIAQTCVGLEDSGTFLKLEKGARLGEYTSISGNVHLQDFASVGEYTSLSGQITLAARSHILPKATIRGDVVIGPRSEIGYASLITGKVIIHRDVKLGDGCRILSGEEPSSKVTIEPTSIVEAGATLLPGSKVGAGSTIKSGATLTGYLPKDSTLTADGTIISNCHSGPTNPLGGISDPKEAPHYLIPTLDAISTKEGAAQYSYRLDSEFTLDFLLSNKASDTFVVSLHGAVDRSRGSLPRYEWFKSLNATNNSCLFLSDPALEVNPELRLGWFLGSNSLDLHKELAQVIQTLKPKVGAKRIILLGLSGGGLAALQISRLIPGSTALVFNPRTEIPVELSDGSIWWTFYFYLKNVAPELAPIKAKASYLKDFYKSPLNSRISARDSFSKATNNKVLYYTNVDEPYHLEECVPFKSALFEGNDVSFVEYHAGKSHTAPNPDLFQSAIKKAIEISEC